MMDVELSKDKHLANELMEKILSVLYEIASETVQKDLEGD